MHQTKFHIIQIKGKKSGHAQQGCAAFLVVTKTKPAFPPPTMASPFTAGQWALTRLAHRIAPSLRRTDRGSESGLEWERLVSDEKPASPSTHPCMTSSMPTG